MMCILKAHHRNVKNQQTRDVVPVLGQCWASVVDGGPALAQYRDNVSRLLSSFGITSQQFCSILPSVFITLRMKKTAAAAAAVAAAGVEARGATKKAAAEDGRSKRSQGSHGTAVSKQASSSCCGVSLALYQ